MDTLKRQFNRAPASFTFKNYNRHLSTSIFQIIDMISENSQTVTKTMMKTLLSCLPGNTDQECAILKLPVISCLISPYPYIIITSLNLPTVESRVKLGRTHMVITSDHRPGNLSVITFTQHHVDLAVYYLSVVSLNSLNTLLRNENRGQYMGCTDPLYTDNVRTSW